MRLRGPRAHRGRCGGAEGMGRHAPRRWVLLLSVPAHQGRYGPADELVGHFPPLRSRRHDGPAGQLRLHPDPAAAVRAFRLAIFWRLGATWSAGGGSPRLRPCRSPSGPPDPAACSSHPAAFACAARWGTARFRGATGVPNTATGLVSWPAQGGPGRGKTSRLTATAVVRRLPWTGRSVQRAGRATR